MKKLVPFIFCLVASACSYGTPTAFMPNPYGITVTYAPEYAPQAMRMVRDHCADYGRAPVLSMSRGEDGKIETYECK